MIHVARLTQNSIMPDLQLTSWRLCTGLVHLLTPAAALLRHHIDLRLTTTDRCWLQGCVYYQMITNIPSSVSGHIGSVSSVTSWTLRDSLRPWLHKCRYILMECLFSYFSTHSMRMLILWSKENKCYFRI